MPSDAFFCPLFPLLVFASEGEGGRLGGLRLFFSGRDGFVCAFGRLEFGAAVFCLYGDAFGFGFFGDVAKEFDVEQSVFELRLFYQDMFGEAELS